MRTLSAFIVSTDIPIFIASYIALTIDAAIFITPNSPTAFVADGPQGYGCSASTTSKVVIGIVLCTGKFLDKIIKTYFFVAVVYAIGIFMSKKAAYNCKHSFFMDGVELNL